MQNKQKVTLYIPPEIYHQLKIRSAVELESMSTLVEKAVVFYLDHPEIVDQVNDQIRNLYQVHNCPDCATPLVLKDGELVAVGTSLTVISESDDDLKMSLKIKNITESTIEINKEETLVETLVGCASGS